MKLLRKSTIAIAVTLLMPACSTQVESRKSQPHQVESRKSQPHTVDEPSLDAGSKTNSDTDGTSGSKNTTDGSKDITDKSDGGTSPPSQDNKNNNDNQDRDNQPPPPVKKIDTFKVTASTVLQRRDGDHFPAIWTTENRGSYLNTTGRALSLVKVEVTLDALPYDPNKNVAAAVDVCVVMQVPNIKTRGTMTGSELLCVGQGKTGGQWPSHNFNIPFPGRGHLVPPGARVKCNSQGGLLAPAAVNNLTKFKCEMTFRDAELKTSLPLVQSIRTPYFDESFAPTHNVSRKVRHQNSGTQNLKVHGVWTFAGMRGNLGKGCLYYSVQGGQQSETCVSLPSNASTWTTPIGFRSFPKTLRRGDSLSAACEITERNYMRRTYCSFYFMVEVAGDNLHKLTPKSTIPKWHRDQYCNSKNDIYIISDKILDDECQSRLSQ